MITHDLLIMHQLMCAVAKEDIESIKTILVHKKININEEGVGFDPRHTPLTYAVANARLGSIKCLLECGADINKSNDSGYTPLETALYYKDDNMPDIVEYLLKHGAKKPIHKHIVNFKCQLTTCEEELKKHKQKLKLIKKIKQTPIIKSLFNIFKLFTEDNDVTEDIKEDIQILEKELKIKYKILQII